MKTVQILRLLFLVTYVGLFYSCNDEQSIDNSLAGSVSYFFNCKSEVWENNEIKPPRGMESFETIVFTKRSSNKVDMYYTGPVNVQIEKMVIYGEPYSPEFNYNGDGFLTSYNLMELTALKMQGKISRALNANVRTEPLSGPHYIGDLTIECQDGLGNNYLIKIYEMCDKEISGCL